MKQKQTITKTIQRFDKTQFFEQINKIDKTLSKLVQRQMQIDKI